MLLHTKKEYLDSTFHTAVSIVDRYISALNLHNCEAPESTLLATVALLVAAKLEQPMSPSFNKMLTLLSDKKREVVTK